MDPESNDWCLYKKTGEDTAMESGGVKTQPECGRMTYKTGHQARRGPWTVSLLGCDVALPTP